jgi:hypothetical protein
VPNCIGWALRDTTQYWDPTLTGFKGGYYWPEGVARDDAVETWLQLFALFGYRECDTGSLEPGFEKLVIYARRPGDPPHEAQHVARQLPSGAWTSKLGQAEDIEHQDADGLSGDQYGVPVRFMKRERPA